MKADYENLFEMADPLNNRWMRLSPAEDPRWGRPDFDQWADQLLRGEAEADPPLRLVHKMGGKPADVMWSTFISFVVISERVVELLRAHGFTGWKTYAVEIHDRKGQRLPGYFGLGQPCGGQAAHRSGRETLPGAQGALLPGRLLGWERFLLSGGRH